MSIAVGTSVPSRSSPPRDVREQFFSLLQLVLALKCFGEVVLSDGQELTIIAGGWFPRGQLLCNRDRLTEGGF